MRPAWFARAGLALAIGACGAAMAAADTGVKVRVTFRADGQCSIAGEGEGFRANLSYMPTGDGPGDEFRCVVPSTPRGRPVELAVQLPAGVEPARGEFPRLEWQFAGDGWQGHAALPAAPAFVRIPRQSSPAARRAGWLDASAFVAMGIAVGWTLVYTARAR